MQIHIGMHDVQRRNIRHSRRNYTIRNAGCQTGNNTHFARERAIEVASSRNEILMSSLNHSLLSEVFQSAQVAVKGLKSRRWARRRRGMQRLHDLPRSL